VHDDLAPHIERLDRDGYTIVLDAFDAERAAALDADVDRLERELGIVPAANGFEGRSTTRVYNLLALGSLYHGIPVHPVVLPLMHHLLGTGCLVTSLSSIPIHPGEIAQPIHADDQVIPLAKPHRPVQCNTIWAVTDFTEANGATRVIPGSQHWPDALTHTVDETVPAEMAIGSCLLYTGKVYHGGGANTTDEVRIAANITYCVAWLRQEENQYLSVPREIAATLDDDLLRLMGYRIGAYALGYIDDARDPLEAIRGRSGAMSFGSLPQQ